MSEIDLEVIRNGLESQKRIAHRADATTVWVTSSPDSQEFVKEGIERFAELLRYGKVLAAWAELGEDVSYAKGRVLHAMKMVGKEQLGIDDISDVIDEEDTSATTGT